jgi:molybdate transport system substrate-binding protein
VVYAAASLTESFQKLSEAFRRWPGGCSLLLNFGGSSGLRTQIEQGAYADLFASANEAQMERLRIHGMIHPWRIFAENRLTLLIPASNPGRIHDLGDLARPGLRLILTHSQVPVGRYALQVVKKLPQIISLPKGFPQAVQANVVSLETNVKQVVAKVAFGEADAGFTYQTDLRPNLQTKVRSLAIPEAANIRARYPIAILRETHHPELAQAFLSFLASPEAQKILTSFGFLAVSSLPESR